MPSSLTALRKRKSLISPLWQERVAKSFWGPVASSGMRPIWPSCVVAKAAVAAEAEMDDGFAKFRAVASSRRWYGWDLRNALAFMMRVKES